MSDIGEWFVTATDFVVSFRAGQQDDVIRCGSMDHDFWTARCEHEDANPCSDQPRHDQVFKPPQMLITCPVM